MKNFVTRCVAALAGNGAIMVTLGNYVANARDTTIMLQQLPYIGGIFLIALVGVICAYSALDCEESAPNKAKYRLRWSARIFFGAMFSFGLAAISIGFQ